MKNSDFIVPIFIKDGFSGTGFIVGNTLITAAHVVISEKSSFFILYRGQKINIGPEKIIILEYLKGKDIQGQNNRYWDLAVYKLDNIVSPIELGTPNLKESCIYQGFSDSTTQMDIYENIKIDDKDWYHPQEKSSPIRINNTYISVGGKCKGGNSGGPLFQRNYVVGMLVGNQQYQSFSLDRYIQSDYILEKLSI